MKNQLHIFIDKDFGRISVLWIDGRPWFIGQEIVNAMGYSNSKKALLDYVDAKDRQVLLKSQFENLGYQNPHQGLTIINVSGICSLLLSSKLPSAKKFKLWMIREVFPSIYNFGAHIADEETDEVLADHDYISELRSELEAEKNKTAQLEDLATELWPKAVYHDLILQSENTIPVSLIAQDYGMTAAEFNSLLHELHIQYKISGYWHLYKPYAGKGYTKTRTYFVNETTSTLSTQWTQSGRLFLFNTLKKHGILPIIQSTKKTERYSEMSI